MMIAHCADLHPKADGTLAGKLVLDPETGQSVTLTDLRKSLAWVTREAVTAGCKLMLVTGDAYDTASPDMNEVRVMRDWGQKLALEMPVVVLLGNHDASQNPKDATALETLKGLHQVSVIERPMVLDLHLDGEPAQIFCLPYPQRSTLAASLDLTNLTPEEVTVTINQGLRAIVMDFVARRKPGYTHILCAHGSVANVRLGEQPRSLEHDVLLPSDLFRHFHCTALGHIHQRQEVGPNAWYCGSLVRNGFGEEGEEKGFQIVDVTPAKTEVRFLENPYARVYKTLSVEDLKQNVMVPAGDPNEPVYRVKGQVTEQEYAEIKEYLQEAASTITHFQDAVEIVKESRMRDAEMASLVLDEEQALIRVLTGKADEAEMPAILDRHREMVGRER